MLDIGGNLKAPKMKLAIRIDRLYLLRYEQGNLMHNMDELIKVGERLYTRLYASGVRQE